MIAAAWRPGGRRWRIGWALVAGVGLIAVWPAVRSLGAVRDRNALLAAALAHPPKPVALLRDDGMLAAPSQAAAEAALATLVRTATVEHGVLLETAAIGAQARPPIAALRFMVSGDADHVVQFAGAIENRTPVIRLANWRLVAGAGHRLRLEGEAVALWSDRR